MEAAAGGVDDMTKLSYLHEPGVLQNLAIRYELNEIYVCQFFFYRLLCDHFTLLERVVISVILAKFEALRFTLCCLWLTFYHLLIRHILATFSLL
jgi:hypothetical protein